MPNPVTKEHVGAAVEAVRKVEAEDKSVAKDFKQVVADLKAAQKGGQEDVVAMHGDRMKRVVAALVDSIADLDKAVGVVNGLREDPDFVEKNHKTIADLLNRLQKMRTEMVARLEEGRRRVEGAVMWKEMNTGNSEDITVEIAVVEDGINDVAAQIEKAEKELEDVVRRLDEAEKNKNGRLYQRAAEAAKALDFGPFEKSLGEQVKKLEDVRKRYANFEAVKEADPLVERVRSLALALRVDKLELKKVQDRTKNPPKFPADLMDPEEEDEVEPSKGPGLMEPEADAVDMKKAARILGIDPKHIPKLAKVLNGKRADWPSGLTKLARELSLAEPDGKKLVELLVKSKLVARAS
jgi:hypothetical protein